jgi:uncharacterized protein
VRNGALALLLALLVAAPLVAAQDEELLGKLDIPVQGSGWVTVTGNAGALDAGTRAELEDLAARYQKGSGHDVAVLIIPTLAGEPIEKVGLQVFRTWKLGRVDVNDGALLLIALDDHELRIEVGRGLEGELTDLVCGRIVRDVIVPHLKQGDLSGGVRAGVIAIHAAAGGEHAELTPQTVQVGHSNPFGPLVPLFVVVFIVLALLRGRGRGKRVGSGWRRSVSPFPLGFPGGLGGLGGFGGGLGGGFGGGGFGGGGFGGGGGHFGGFGGGGGAIGGGASGKW